MAFENIRNPLVRGILAQKENVSKPPLGQEAKTFVGENLLKPINPEDESHITQAHRLDKESAGAGLLTTDGEEGLLSEEDFHNWTHAGDTSKNPWRQLDLVQATDTGELIGFINSYAPERGVKKRLAEAGKISFSKANVDEIEWYLPENATDFERKIIAQHLLSRFRQGTDLVTHWVDADSLTPEVVALHTKMGFSEVYRENYMDEPGQSVCFSVDRSSFARAALEQMAGT